MSVFAIDLYFSSRGLPPATMLTLAQFMAASAHWRVLADLALLALFAGIYSVPMYALIQIRSQPTHRARIIAANNILNALFMIVSALGAGVLLSLGFSRHPQPHERYLHGRWQCDRLPHLRRQDR